MPTNARKKHWIGTGGPWGTGLLLLGLAVIVQGIGYTTAQPHDLSPALSSLSQIVPPLGWGLLWIAAGIWSVWKALTPPQEHWEILPATGVLLLWSMAHLIFWFFTGLAGDWTRTWTSAVGWGMLSGLVICWGRCVNPPTRDPGR